MKEFLRDTIKKNELAPILTDNVPIKKVTPLDEEDFKSATHCYLCHQPLSRTNVKTTIT